MKKSQDPRHLHRKTIVQSLFAQSFMDQPTHDTKTDEIIKNLSYIDSVIEKIAPDYPADKINKVDLAILRLASYELLLEKKEPSKVIIDEAIELAKEFGGDTSPGFINGALGKLITEYENTNIQ